jgi:GNAT superfamily N-acetyltransferase/rubrerythrin
MRDKPAADEKAGASYALTLSAEGGEQRRAWLRDAVRAFNDRMSPAHREAHRPGQVRPLDLFLDSGDEIVAGLTSDTYWDWWEVLHLWVAEDRRGHGLGRRLMEAAEREALRRGCRHAQLTTFGFQAPGFYARLGFRVVGRLDDFPPGIVYYWLRKDLTWNTSVELPEVQSDGGNAMPLQLTDESDPEGQLVALAERCASEGQMNLNKLLEAAVYARSRRAGWRHRPQVTRGTMQRELADAIERLKEEELTGVLVAPLQAGLQAMAEGRGDDLLAEVAPDAFVCRTCGHVSLGAAPDRCPDCGSWPGRTRKFVAFFNGDNAEPADPLGVLALLAHNAEDLERLVADLSEEEMRRPPAAGEWSIREHVAHFYDTQEMLDTRVDLMLEHDDPDLTPLAVYELATEAERHPASTQAMLAEFRRRRARCLERLGSRPLSDLWRSGRHPEFGRLTILRQAAYLAYHEQTHLPEIESLCAQVAAKH